MHKGAHRPMSVRPLAYPIRVAPLSAMPMPYSATMCAG